MSKIQKWHLEGTAPFSLCELKSDDGEWYKVKDVEAAHHPLFRDIKKGFRDLENGYSFQIGKRLIERIDEILKQEGK